MCYTSKEFAKIALHSPIGAEAPPWSLKNHSFPAPFNRSDYTRPVAARQNGTPKLLIWGTNLSFEVGIRRIQEGRQNGHLIIIADCKRRGEVPNAAPWKSPGRQDVVEWGIEVLPTIKHTCLNMIKLSQWANIMSHLIWKLIYSIYRCVRKAESCFLRPLST